MKLLELLVVMVLIGLIGGAVGIRLHHSHREAQFQEAVNGIASKLDLAQELMLALESDVTIHFTAHKKGVQLRLDLECNLPDGLKQLARPAYFAGITSWEPNELHNPSNETLHLEGPHGEATLKFRGYPAPVLNS